MHQGVALFLNKPSGTSESHPAHTRGPGQFSRMHTLHLPEILTLPDEVKSIFYCECGHGYVRCRLETRIHFGTQKLGVALPEPTGRVRVPPGGLHGWGGGEGATLRVSGSRAWSWGGRGAPGPAAWSALEGRSAWAHRARGGPDSFRPPGRAGLRAGRGHCRAEVSGRGWRDCPIRGPRGCTAP